MLKRLLEWKIGISYNFQVSAGKCGKCMEQLLPDTVYQTFLTTYAKTESEALWQTVFTMCEQFHGTTIEVGCQLGLTYNARETLNSMKYLKSACFLPRSAKGLQEYMQR